MRVGTRLTWLGICTLGLSLSAGTGAGTAAARTRVVEFHIAVSATQTSSWSAGGAREWCAGQPSLTVPYEGSGSVAIHASGETTFPFALGSRPAVHLELSSAIDRAGAFVEHDGSVSTQPLECPPLPEADSPAEAGGCGHETGMLPADIFGRGPPGVRLTTKPGSTPTLGCPGIASVLIDAGAELTSADAHPESKDALQPITLTGLLAPRTAPFAPTAATGHASSSWKTSLPGGSLSVNTTSEARAGISLVAMISAGRGISNIHLGETYSALRRGAAHLGGLSVSDSGLLDSDKHHWIWPVDVHVPQLETQGGNILERTWVSTPAGPHSGPLRHGPPPAGARVAQVSTTGTYEVTPTGAGEGMTLSALRRAEPHGHLIYFGRPIAWAVEGPGRHRTAFTLFRGTVQSVEVGCRQTDPHQPGAPVSDDRIC